MNRAAAAGLAWALLASLAYPARAHEGEAFDAQTELAPFVAETVERHGLDAARVRTLVADARFRPGIIGAMSRPAERLSWARYRAIFLTDTRVMLGVEFLREHAATLERARERYGVAPEVITAIIGVETLYGRHAGKHRVLDSLATLAFRHQRRGRFFRDELGHYLALADAEGLDPLVLVGSYAGAMGIPQFIPSSYRHYAVDFDGDGRRDLLGNAEDAIGSVANYLARHGWRDGVAVASPAAAGADVTAILERGYEPHASLDALGRSGVRVEAPAALDGELALVSLDGEAGDELWAVSGNFYAITRYNRSKLYAMAVHQLAASIRREHGGPDG